MLNHLKRRKAIKGSPAERTDLPAEGGNTARAGVSPQPEVRRKILVVGQGAGLAPEVMDYAINLAERLQYDLVALNVNPALEPAGRTFSPYKRLLRGRFARRADAANAAFREKVGLKGLHLAQVVKFGDLGQAVADLNREVKRIEFIITAPGIKEEEVSGGMTLPVFSIKGTQGDMIMAYDGKENRGKLIGKTIGYGIATAVFYAAVFLNSDAVMRYFTKGGMYAALPVVTVFLVSFVHGAFASNLWSCLGIEAAKKVQPRVAPRPAPRKRPRPELRLNA